MRRLPILAVLLTAAASLREGSFQPREAERVDRDDGAGEAAAPVEIQAPVEPGFAVALPPVPVEPRDLPRPARKQTGFGTLAGTASRSAPADARFEPQPEAAAALANFPGADLGALTPAVLLRPVDGIGQALGAPDDSAAAVIPGPAFAGSQPRLAPADAIAPSIAVDPEVFSAPADTLRAEPPPAGPAPAGLALPAISGDPAKSPSGAAALAVAPQAPPLPTPGGVSASSAEKSVFDGDFFIVVAGAVALPSYEGSDDTAVIPAATVAGRIGGIGINARAAGVALDLVPEADGAKVGIGLGPVVRFRTNRSARIKDPVVASLGKLKGVLEAGVAASVTIRRPFNGHDQLTLGADVRWDVSGHGSGYVVAPSISYLTPLSRAQVAGLLISGEFADGRFAHYNYDVSAAGNVASGLPVYSAHGGFKAANIGLFTARDLNGNLLDGGFAIGVGAMYTRLFGSAAQTPLTAIRGNRNQWYVAGGLGYVF